MVPFVQFKKRWKHSWRSATFSKIVDWNLQFYLKFSRFLNCKNGTKSRKASHTFRNFINWIALLTSDNSASWIVPLLNPQEEWRHTILSSWITNYRDTIWKICAPADAGPKLNVHKTFRRCPGRLLNILCTLNLRPLSMVLRGYVTKWSLKFFDTFKQGYKNVSKNYFYYDHRESCT